MWLYSKLQRDTKKSKDSSEYDLSHMSETQGATYPDTNFLSCRDPGKAEAVCFQQTMVKREQGAHFPSKQRKWAIRMLYPKQVQTLTEANFVTSHDSRIIFFSLKLWLSDPPGQWSCLCSSSEQESCSRGLASCESHTQGSVQVLWLVPFTRHSGECWWCDPLWWRGDRLMDVILVFKIGQPGFSAWDGERETKHQEWLRDFWC